MTYIALDLELNRPVNGNPAKVIQIGIAWGSPKTGIGGKKSWILNPNEPIDPFITELTGINDSLIQAESVAPELVCEELTTIVQREGCFRQPVTWGEGDLYALRREFSAQQIPLLCFGRRSLDVKTIHTFLRASKQKSVRGGLGSALKSYGLSFEGNPHWAQYDALNTLNLFFFLLKEQGG